MSEMLMFHRESLWLFEVLLIFEQLEGLKIGFDSKQNGFNFLGYVLVQV